MPIYEYECSQCEHAFEELVSTDRRKKISCPSCGSDKTRIKFSIFSARNSHEPVTTMPAGGCGRCGDPNGPCGLD